MMINQTVVGVHVVKLDSGINTEESLGSCLQRGSRPLHRYLQDKEKRSRAAVSDGKAHEHMPLQSCSILSSKNSTHLHRLKT